MRKINMNFLLKSMTLAVIIIAFLASSLYAEEIPKQTYKSLLKKEVVVHLYNNKTIKGKLIKNGSDIIVIQNENDETEIFKDNIKYIRTALESDDAAPEQFDTKPRKPLTTEDKTKREALINEYTSALVSGNNMTDIGKALLVSGIVLDIAGVASLIIGMFGNSIGNKDEKMTRLTNNGFICLGSGVVFTATGVTFRILGNNRISESIKLKSQLSQMSVSFAPMINVNRNTYGLSLNITY